MMDKTIDDKKLIAQARKYVDEVWDQVVHDIDWLVQVESVDDSLNASEGMPFGPAPREALNRALHVAERLGLDCHNCEGYIGYADLPGKSETYLATIGHVDIVPLGDGWTVDPLRVTRKEGYLLGRGAIDDKGPLILSLYAAHFFVRRLRACGEKFPYTLRCIVGVNEETGMKDVEYYTKHYPQPAFCFTPDASFPLICGEKGHFVAEIASPPLADNNTRIVSLEGGAAINAVPGKAEALVRASAKSLRKCEGVTVEPSGVDGFGNDLCRVVAMGRGGHAAMPEETINAIGILIRYLLDNGICNDEERRFLEFERILMADYAGAALGIAAEDDVFDPLTCVGGMVSTRCEGSNHRIVQTIDVRYPKSTTGNKICKQVEKVAQNYGCLATAIDDAVPIYMAPDSNEVKAMIRTYNEITGQDGKAFTIGGGTYSRHFSRAVAFGPDDEDTNKPSWVGIEHGADEGVSEALLKRALVVYIVAIARLMRLDY